MKTIFSKVKLRPGQIVQLFLLVLLSAVGQMLLPSFLAQMISHGVAEGENRIVWMYAVIMAGVTLFSCVISFLSVKIASYISTDFAAQLRTQVFSKVQEFSAAEMDRFGTASLVTRSTSDITNVQNFLTLLLRVGLLAPMMAAAGLVFSAATGGEVSSVLLVAIPVLLTVLTIIIEDKLAGELVIETALSVENIFMACLNGQIHRDEIVDGITHEKYGFTLADRGNLFVVWLGNGYMEQREMTQKILEKLGQNQEFSVCVLPIDEWHLFTVIIYGPEKKTIRYPFFKNEVVSRLSGMIRGELVCLWEDVQHLEMLNVSLKNLRMIREWNLFFDRGDLIRREDVESMEIVPLKYPAELENRLRRSAVISNRKEIIKCYYTLYDLCKRDPHSPSQIKEVLIRFNMAVLNAYKLKREIHSELQVQKSMQDIAKAMSWGEIRAAVELFFRTLNFQAEEENENADLSPLIQKALQMVKKEYDQGITLEEMADKLFVSEEYLSSQFKKEIGVGFKEMVRTLQIERIKELLTNTKLKLNQIAELAGYSDAKYMSRVFKDEVGVLPSEFRKSAHC